MNHSTATRISVAMGTYNGERFLPQQLASILQQTRQPDEMIVGDDGSTDATIPLLEEFARAASFPVTILRNKSNLGSTQNFIQITRLCTGDLIALSDQDDIWYPNRLERSEQLLSLHPEAGLLFSDADLIDEAGNLLNQRLWKRCDFTPQVQHHLAQNDYIECVSMRFVTGATVMFRTWLRDYFPPEPGWIHDEWLAAVAPLYSDLLPLEDPLIQYRQHASQQVGPSLRVGLLSRLAQRVHMLVNPDLAQTVHWHQLKLAEQKTQAVCDRFLSQPLGSDGGRRLQAYQQYATFQGRRTRLPPLRLRRVLPILRLISAYATYYPFRGLGSVLRDLLFQQRSSIDVQAAGRKLSH